MTDEDWGNMWTNRARLLFVFVSAQIQHLHQFRSQVSKLLSECWVAQMLLHTVESKLQQFWRKFHLLSFNYRHAGYDFVNFFKPRTLNKKKQSSTYTYQPCWVLPKVDRYYPRYYLRKCRRKQLGPWSGGATQCQGRKGTVLSREFRRPCSQSEGEFVSDEGFLVLAI